MRKNDKGAAKQPLAAGARTAILARRKTPGDDEAAVNAEMARLEAEARSAGFKTDFRSIIYSGGRIVILYDLSEDPSFRPPM